MKISKRWQTLRLGAKKFGLFKQVKTIQWGAKELGLFESVKSKAYKKWTIKLEIIKKKIITGDEEELSKKNIKLLVR